jgi:pyridoxamine 5'-phosphate oxidase
MADGVHEELSERDVAAEPFTQFARWYDDARAALGDDADAVVVATADASGEPSARVVLLRGFDERGFCFYTSYDSRKGRDLAINPRAALVWHWPGLRRQVRATGRVERMPADEADAYWAARPLASRLSAWASRQSEPVANRAELEAAVEAVRDRFGVRDVTRPPFWGGFRVVPDEVEFWLHRDDRLHDRVRYQWVAEDWVIERLQP